MFSSGSPYSPFFTSGLLAIDAPPPTPEDFPRRGSLPTDSLSAKPASSATSFYFTLQPARDHKEYRSFLSLDLAESQSLRSASLKRKAPAAQVPAVPRLAPPATQALRARYSRDSFRSIPSPKPAPCMNLPELPKPASRSPTPVRPSTSTSVASDLPLPVIRISRTPAPVAILPLKKPSRTSTSSSVSTRARKINRSHALERLEGKQPIAAAQPRTAPPSVSQFSMRRNFMSMTDDESDDEDSDIDSLDAKSDYSDDFFDTASDNRLFYTGYLEPEDHVLPLVSSPPRPKSVSSSPSPSPTRSTFVVRKQTVRRSATDWFPLKSFIDLRGGDDASSFAVPAPSSPTSSPTSPTSSWSWRSFIDVASL
ncbi:hypothetical protein D9611_006399 [Ephemerocybe angulata]|uniref:Uncharacterized protein n=1 Tax=Ephemerocybe angulata TaxID=980116 RepID=A0A8H5C7P8_9AGAR|nr:hypothetical protein D9611_006399 [Tulosesus angulatus]